MPALFLVGKHREPQSINAKLFSLPMIPIGVRSYTFVGQPLSKQLYHIGKAD